MTREAVRATWLDLLNCSYTYEWYVRFFYIIDIFWFSNKIISFKIIFTTNRITEIRQSINHSNRPISAVFRYFSNAGIRYWKRKLIIQKTAWILMNRIHNILETRLNVQYHKLSSVSSTRLYFTMSFNILTLAISFNESVFAIIHFYLSN